ncbi:hypothetical protein TNCV_1651 [Trichonephila clavipes]|nr:hypothetical protein TNCV_1651 [Trichonephila clavipes]
MSLRDTEERYQQPIERSGLSPSSRLQRSVVQSSAGLAPIFPNGVGVKAQEQVAGYANSKGIGIEMVPSIRRSVTVPLNRNRSFQAERNHFPLKPAYSLTIHKSQGTFDEIVYKYS